MGVSRIYKALITNFSSLKCGMKIVKVLDELIHLYPLLKKLV